MLAATREPKMEILVHYWPRILETPTAIGAVVGTPAAALGPATKPDCWG